MLVLRNISAGILEFFHSSKNNKLFTIVERDTTLKTKNRFKMYIEPPGSSMICLTRRLGADSPAIVRLIKGM